MVDPVRPPLPAVVVADVLAAGLLVGAFIVILRARPSRFRKHAVVGPPDAGVTATLQ